jgi:hypothetical protein
MGAITISTLFFGRQQILANTNMCSCVNLAFWQGATFIYSRQRNNGKQNMFLGVICIVHFAFTISGNLTDLS